MFSLRKTAEQTASLLPDFVLSAQEIAATLMQGGHHRRVSGAGEKFWQFRPYTHDDDTRHIDWRQSARQDTVYIRQKELQTHQSFLFWCAGGPSMRFSSRSDVPEKLHAAQSLLFALALVFARTQNAIAPLGMRASSYHAPALSVLQNALESADAALPDPAQLSITRRSHVFLASDFLAPLDEIAQGFEQLAAQTRNGFVFHIVDPAERHLPYSGRVRFETSDDTPAIEVDHAQDIRDDYLEKMQAHSDGIRALCEQHGWHYFMHDTSTGALETLFPAMNILSAEMSQ